MSQRQRLDAYLHALTRRMRAHLLLRAGAVWMLSALVWLFASVSLARRLDYSAQVLMFARGLLLLVTLVIVGWLVHWPLRTLRRRPAREFERRMPEQQGRIQTFLALSQQERARNPLAELLASDALSRAPSSVGQVVPTARLQATAAIAALAAGAVLALLIAGPAHWGYGSRHLLLGTALPQSALALREVSVTPGDITIRRNGDLTIRATTQGFDAQGAEVFVRFQGEPQWERASMQAVEQQASRSWQFKLFAVRGAFEYYVVAHTSRIERHSSQHRIQVVDLPQIEQLRLSYRYPQWTGLADHAEDSVRGIRGVQGTQVKIDVVADAPLQTPVIAIGADTTHMQRSGNEASGQIQLREAGSYRISARVANEWVALTDDYPIEIVEDGKPSVEIRKPGRDWQATSIEEVPVELGAQDDFNLQQLALRYSVNGGDWRTIPLQSGVRETQARSVLRLEEIGAHESGEAGALQPGDLVSYYAIARDHKHSVQTDLFMVQVQPFERRFTQGQGGGVGGIGDEQGAISQRQREILLATWNLLRAEQTASRARSQLADSANMLAQMQTKLAAQASRLLERTRARSSTQSDARVAQFTESLERAVAAMQPAADHLQALQLQPAIPAEQQALQHLLRAEAAFRDVQVALQRESTGGGQPGERNFTEMFELEMDVDKNHYETQSTLSERNDREEQDETIRKLKELAERQERLARQLKQPSVSPQEHRWQQEKLRREAQDLERRLAQMQQLQRSRSGSSSDRPADATSSEEAARESRRDLSGGTQPIDSVREALENMQRANDALVDSQSLQRSAAQAGRNLREALAGIDRAHEQSLAQQAEQLANRAQGLSNQQQRIESELYRALGEAMNAPRDRGQLSASQAQQLIEGKQRMADELGAMQQEMRAAINDHRERNPEATQRMTQALTELEEMSLAARLNRSAAEIRYGRARDAAPREGLIADALQGLENNLRTAAQLAAGESQQHREQDGAEQLLARLGELRRELGSQASEQKVAGQLHISGNASDASDPSRSQSTPSRMSPALTDDAARSPSRQFDDLANLGEKAGFDARKIASLRRLSQQARQLQPGATARLSALSLIDQLELEALGSIERSRRVPPARTPVGAGDAEQSDMLAEYYRRLGSGGCTDKAAQAC
jgi:hypothetical protein